MRKVLAAALAVPVVALIVARSLGQRAGTRRLSAIAAVLAIGAVVAVSSIRPVPTTATPPTRISALDAGEFTTQIQTSESPAAPVTISFPSPMNGASVEDMLRITPGTAVRLSWDATGSLLTVAPAGAWKPGTYYTVTVGAGALDATGRPLERRLRAAFLTRPAVVGTIGATVVNGAEATIATAFRLAFSGPIDESTLDVLISPVVDGAIAPAADSVTGAPSYEFVPADPLDPDLDYTVALGPGTLDADGAPIEATAFTIRTAATPAVVRFRPRNGWADVTWSQKLSVRFTEPMDHASTEAAWSATQGTTALTGTFAWAEGDTVLVFDPKGVLGYSQKVTMVVAAGALSKAGLPLQAAASAAFTTAARVVQPPAGGGTGGGTGGGSGGGTAGPSVGAGTWAAVETWYLGLMN